MFLSVSLNVSDMADLILRYNFVSFFLMKGTVELLDMDDSHYLIIWEGGLRRWFEKYLNIYYMG